MTEAQKELLMTALVNDGFVRSAGLTWRKEIPERGEVIVADYTQDNLAITVEKL